MVRAIVGGVFLSPLCSQEGWPIIWVFSSLLRIRQRSRRIERISAAIADLEWMVRRFQGKRPPRYGKALVAEQVDNLLKHYRVKRYLEVKFRRLEHHRFRQASPGRPGPKTAFHRTSRLVYLPEWKTNDAAIEYDKQTDGMYPLLTNDRNLKPADVLQAHKRQPALEKRFEQMKSVFNVTPVLLKNESRIEALFFLYFLALLIQALIEREIRGAMHQQSIKSLPLYPEERKNKHPTCEQIFRLFASLQRSVLYHAENPLKVFHQELTPLQVQVLQLLQVPENACR